MARSQDQPRESRRRPEAIEAPLGVYTWSGREELVHVLCGAEVVEAHVDVSDDQLDALLDHVAGDVVLPEGEEPYDLTVVRGDRVLGHVLRRPGRRSTVTRY